jgi:hypothetical protein
VRRNRWGTWTATGTYSGPEIGEPRELISGWCWTRSQAIAQVGYWIEDAAALDRTWWLSSGELHAYERAAYDEDLVRHVEHRANQELEAAQTAAQQEDADRTAEQLLAAILHETTLANTPLEVQFPDSGYGPHDFPDDHTREAEDRFAEHLRTDPSLRTLPKWDRFYVGLDEETTQDTEDLDRPADDELPGRYCGLPGLVWYSRVTKTRGDQLKVGHALDSLDHRGARTIRGIRVATPGSGFREVHFGGGWSVYADGSSDTETVRDDVMYDVVDMDSICDPMGNPA